MRPPSSIALSAVSCLLSTVYCLAPAYPHGVHKKYACFCLDSFPVDAPAHSVIRPVNAVMAGSGRLDGPGPSIQCLSAHPHLSPTNKSGDAQPLNEAAHTRPHMIGPSLSCKAVQAMPHECCFVVFARLGSIDCNGVCSACWAPCV